SQLRANARAANKEECAQCARNMAAKAAARRSRAGSVARTLRTLSQRRGIERIMRPAELAVGRHLATRRDHRRDLFDRTVRERVGHLLGRTGAAETHRLRLK